MVFQTSVVDGDGDRLALTAVEEMHGTGQLCGEGEAGEDAFVADEAAGPVEALIV